MRRAMIDVEGVLLDEDLTVTFSELGQLCGSSAQVLELLIDEGVLDPRGRGPEDWRFSGREVRRARRLLRLQRDLDLDLTGAALALDLLEEIEGLRARLRVLERRTRLRDRL